MNDSVVTCDPDPVIAYMHLMLAMVPADAKPTESLAGFMLERARSWPIPAPPLDVKRGIIKECFRNAAMLAMDEPDRYIYCEGYAMSIFPVLHAWCLTTEGQVVDPTWQRKHSGRSMMGVAYFGIAIKLRYLRRHLAEKGYWGQLGTPDWSRPEIVVDPADQWNHPINETRDPAARISVPERTIPVGG
jgi:hypothetical protein